MSAAKAKLEEEEHWWSNTKTTSVAFAKTLCELLVDAGNAALVNSFFTNLFSRVTDRTTFAFSIIPIVRKFDWSKISKALLDKLKKLDDKSCMAMVLHIVDGLDTGSAQISLLKLAVERAAKLPDKILCSSDTVGILWKWVLRSSDKEVLDAVVNIFKKSDPSITSSVIVAVTEYIDEIETSSSEFASIVDNRTVWLEKQIQTLAVSF